MSFLQRNAGPTFIASFTRIIGRAKRDGVKLKNGIKELAWAVSPEGRRNQLELISHKDRFAGRRCFIMGNGPSLLRCDLSLLKDEVTICSNAHYLIWDAMGYTPNYLTVEDRLVAEDRANEFSELTCATQIYPRDLSYCLKKNRYAIYINFTRDYQPFPKFSNHFDKVVYWGGTVSMLNLQLAYYLGCREIYLIGFDHNYKVPHRVIDNVITSDREDVNHIHPNYFGKGYRWHDPNLVRMEQAYLEARRFLEGHGVSVKNATIGGKLEVFERVDYQQLF